MASSPMTLSLPILLFQLPRILLVSCLRWGCPLQLIDAAWLMVVKLSNILIYLVFIALPTVTLTVLIAKVPTTLIWLSLSRTRRVYPWLLASIALLLNSPHATLVLISHLSLVLVILHLLLMSWLKLLRWGSGNCSPACYSFNFLHLQVLYRFLTCLIAEPLVLFIHIQNEFLNVITSSAVLVVVTRAYTEMERFIRLLLAGAFFEARPLTSET